MPVQQARDEGRQRDFTHVALEGRGVLGRVVGRGGVVPQTCDGVRVAKQWQREHDGGYVARAGLEEGQLVPQRRTSLARVVEHHGVMQ
eukprot:1229089-Rhodomonas_salina.2